MNSKYFRELAWNNLKNEGNKSKWGKAALCTFLFGLFAYLFNLVANMIPFVGGIALAVISPVMAFGFLCQMLNLKNSENGEDVGCIDFFKLGFEKFGKVWGVTWHTFTKMWFPILALVIGIIMLGVSITLSSASIINQAAMLSLVAEGYTVDTTSNLPSSGAAGTIVGVIGIIIYIIAIIFVIRLSYKYAFTTLELALDPETSSKEIVNRSGDIMVGNRWRLFKLGFSFIGWALLCALGMGIPTFWILPYIQIANIYFYEDIRNKEIAPATNEVLENNVIEEQ